MNRTLLGLLVLLGVAAVALTLNRFDLATITRQVQGRSPAEVSFFYGGEKSALLKNPKVMEIFAKRYRLTLHPSKAGSIEMATTLDTTGKDCLWPSNMLAVELARDAGKPVQGAETIFNAPIVLYAWDDVATALERAGVVHPRADGALTADLQALVALIEAGKRWKEDLGLDIYGPFKVFSTDPSKSNSGNIWAGLLAIALNGGEPPTEADLPALLPRIAAYFARMGYMEASSGDIFDNFLKQGMGARPLIVGYENQLVEFLTEHADYAALIRKRIRVIYPEPTIFASHPLIALTPGCERLREALTDPELQALAWSEHGFRTGLIGVENDPAQITVTTLPEVVNQVVPMPSARVMEAIIAAVN